MPFFQEVSLYGKIGTSGVLDYCGEADLHSQLLILQQPCAAYRTSYMAPLDPDTPLALQGTGPYPNSAATVPYSAHTPDFGRFDYHNATLVCCLATAARAWCASAFSAVTVPLLCRSLFQYLEMPSSITR